MVAVFRKYFKSNTRELKLQTIIRPVYFATSLFGLFPTSIRYRGSKHKYESIEKSLYINSLCGISFILLLIAFLILHAQDVIFASEGFAMTDGLMTKLNYIMEETTLVVVCLVAYVCAFLNRNKYVKMLNTVITTWNDLSIIESSQKILERLQFQANMSMGSLVTVFFLQISINYTRTNDMWKKILVTFSFNLPQMIQFIYLAFYYTLVMILIALLSNINEQCRQLVGENNNSLFVQPKNTCATINKLELVYIKAFEIKTQINEAFQGPMLATTLQCFHTIVAESHIIYHGVINRTLNTHDIINCSIWILYQVLKIYSLSHSGSLLKTKALQIGQMLHRIPTDKQDVRCLAEIQHFASLMNYQGFEITLYGYFPVDATLLFKILASATMYLIIFVQFDRKV